MTGKFQVGFDYMVVKVDDVTNQVAAVHDDYGKRHDIRTDVRRGKGPLPRPGEVWLVDKTLGMWTFAATLAPILPRIDYPADGALAALLAALNDVGIIEWGSSNYSLAANADYADGVPLSGEALGSGTASFSVASLNVKFLLSKADAQQDIDTMIGNGADIIGLQEMGQRARHDLVRSISGFGNFIPTTEARSLPIIWRESLFSLLDSGSVQVAQPDNRQTGWGWISWVKLTHIPTGKTVIVGNNHAVSQVEARGRYTSEPALQGRVQMHQDHMTGMRDFVNNRTAEGLIFMLGDLNFNFRTDAVVRNPAAPYSKLNTAGMVATYRDSMPQGGTHMGGGRLIDYVMYEKAKSVAPREQRIVRGLNTDHNGVLVSFDLTDVVEPA